MKSLGPSNDDVPEDEIILAKLIQTASARGLVSCRGRSYEDSAGWATQPEYAVACCASGADRLDPERPARSFTGLENGNDTNEGGGNWLGTVSSGFDIGACFEQALRPETEGVS